MTDEAPSSEVAMLLRCLQGEREHVLGILEGLSDEALRHRVLPSGWTCVGLLQHLALDVDRFWFRQIIAGEALAPDDPQPTNAWEVPDATPNAQVFDRYRREAAMADAILAAASTENPPAWWPDERWPNWRLGTVREIALHVIAETATHAGHLDAVRELIDGRQWLVLT